MEDEIQHFSHKHRLLLNKHRLLLKVHLDFHHTCAACRDFLCGDVYCCYDCQYYLHEECAKLKDEIVHFHRPYHSLKLHGISVSKYGPFNCHVCRSSCLGFTYRCTSCDFKMDALCSFESEISLPIHNHKLKLQVGDTETEPSFFCDFCHTRCYSHRGQSLHCEEDCNFKIDLDCARMLLNSQFKLIQHVSHEHWLIYDDCIKARDRKYCAACRKVCDGATYFCKPCYFFLHKSCARYPTEIKLSLHSKKCPTVLPLMLSTWKERERCDFCNLICQALTFRCDLCNFKIDSLCARMLIELRKDLNYPFPPPPTCHLGKRIDHFSHPHSLFLNDLYLRRRISNANCYACRKQLNCFSRFYECSDCAFYLHDSCRRDLIKHYRHYKHIQNHFHNHPLEIVYYHREVPGVVCCTLCRKCCFGPTYVCFLCNFFLHESCLELLGTNTMSQNSSHKHPLIIVDNKVNDSSSYFSLKNDFPSCSACGEPCFEKSFACLKCKFLIHELCLELPHEIQHFFHPCPLSLQQETTMFTCRACEKSHSQFAYHCNRCDFFLDVKCALMFTGNFEGQNYILSQYHHHHDPLILCNKERNDHEVSCDGCIQCDFYLHRSCAAVPHQIEHHFHPKHTLNLFFDEKLLCTVSILKSLDKKGKVKYLRHKHFSIHDDKENEVCCGVCEKNVCGPSYECIRCKFFIHQDCIEPVEEGEHPFQPHDNDSLIGVSRKTLPRKKFTCDACSCKSCFGFSYRCEKCSFNLDANCASLKPSIKYKDHKHLLTFFEKVYDDPQCKVCNSCCSDVSYLRCVECDYNVHLLCAPLPSTIKHKCHIDPLYLKDYFVEDYSGEYYCDACENRRDPRESVYYCKECSNYVAHINCVIDQVLLLLSGKRGDVELRIVDRDNIDEKISKRGLTLKEIFNSSHEDEKREFEDAEAAIVDLVGQIMSKADSGNRDSLLEDLVNSDETFILILKNLKFPMRKKDTLTTSFLESESEDVEESESEDVEVRDHMVSPNMREEDISSMSSLESESEDVEVRDHMVSLNMREEDISSTSCLESESEDVEKSKSEDVEIRDHVVSPNMREEDISITSCLESESEDVEESELEDVEVRDHMVSPNMREEDISSTSCLESESEDVEESESKDVEVKDHMVSLNMREEDISSTSCLESESEDVEESKSEDVQVRDHMVSPNMREEDISSTSFLESKSEDVEVKDHMVSLNMREEDISSMSFLESKSKDVEVKDHMVYPNMREDDISSTSFLESESEDVEVRDHMVSSNRAKYGDIRESSTKDETFIPILKNKLNMTFLELESEVVEVKDYKVSRNCAPILESLFDKYGDIGASSTSNPLMKMRVLNIVGGVAQSMCNTKVKDITANLLLNWWKNFKLAQHVGFNVQFAFDHLYKLAQAQFRMQREFEVDPDLLNSQFKIEDLPTKLEKLKDEQKQLIRSKRRRSILEKECLIEDMESRLMPAGMGLL